METIQEQIQKMYDELFTNGIIRNKRDLANKIDVSEASVYRAMQGDKNYLSNALLAKVALFHKTSLEKIVEPVQGEGYEVSLIPLEARGGSLAEMSQSCRDYECEKIISPIKGATYAIQVTGDSMYPAYPSGSLVLIKQVNEQAFLEWGKVYVLDTENGVIIKQIMPSEKEGRIKCVSLNSSLYPAFEIETKYIIGYYRVLMTMNLN